MIVRKTINVKEPLTPEEKAEIDALENRPIVFDEDCMPLSEDVANFHDYIRRKHKTRRVTRELIELERPIWQKIKIKSERLVKIPSEPDSKSA